MSNLDEYRERCTFNVRALTGLIDGGQELRGLKERVWETLRKDPLFSRSPQLDLTLEEQRKINFKRVKRLQEYAFVTKEELMACPNKARAFNDAIMCYSPSLFAVTSLHKQVCAHVMHCSVIPSAAHVLAIKVWRLEV